MLGGAYNAPAGYQRRLMGGIIRVKERWVDPSLSLAVAIIFSILGPHCWEASLLPGASASPPLTAHLLTSGARRYNNIHEAGMSW